jgi:predicted GNAT family N-acyltransferase
MASWERSPRRRVAISPAPAHKRTVCEIWPLDTAAELIESYRLRYDVYGALGYIRRFNESRLEIDEFDSSSIPFGAFDPTSGVMIGTLRLVTTEIQADYERLIRSVLADIADDELTEQASSPRVLPLPSILSEATARQIEAFNTERFVVHELSRTIVRPSHRGLGISRGLMEFGLAHAARVTPAILIGGCMPEHLPMYAKYGYLKLAESGLDYFDSVGQNANTLVCRTDVLPQPARAHIDDLLHSLRSGMAERMLEIGRNSCALYRFSAPRRARRRTIEW